jgi:galactose oxidase
MSINGGVHGRATLRFMYGPAVAACALAALLASAPIVRATGTHRMTMTGSHAPEMGFHATRTHTTTRPMDMPAMDTAPKGPKTPYAPVIVLEDARAHASSSVPGHPAVEVLAMKGRGWWQSRAGRRGPQSVTIALGGTMRISGLTYVPRSGRRPVGVIGRFRVSVSMDGRHFRRVAHGRWRDVTAAKTVGFTVTSARYVRLTALSHAGGSSRAAYAVHAIKLLGKPSPSVIASKPPGTLTNPLGTPFTAPNLTADPSVVGSWGQTIGLPLIPVAVAPLPNNKLLMWSADQDDAFSAQDTPGQNFTRWAILDLTTGQVSASTVTSTNYDMFCPGIAVLPNGDILVAGGDTAAQSSIYDWHTNTWTSAGQLNIPRGYNGMAALPDGQAITYGGSWETLDPVNGKTAEIWSQTGGWRVLPGVPDGPIDTQDPNPFARDYYPWMIDASHGRLLQIGPSSEMHWITTTGAGSITDAGPRADAPDQTEGNPVYYDIDKVLVTGGAVGYDATYGNSTTAYDATNKAYVVDMSGSTPKVTETGSMAYARSFANGVVLPTGQVIEFGGATYAMNFTDNNAVLNPEMWDPSTGQWTLLAPAPEPRNYHSTAVLLPDGTIFSGGGGLGGPSCDCDHLDGQIYTPPYLLNSDGSLKARPTIDTAPATASDGQTISVTTQTSASDGSLVQSFSMIRYGEATHALDVDQRRIPLQVVSDTANPDGSTTWQLAIPSDPGVAVPGEYMLFAIDSAGTPSVSTMVLVSGPTPAAPSDAYGKAVLADSPAIYWPLQDSSGESAADLSGNRETGIYSTGGVSYGTPSPVEGSDGTGVTLDGSSGSLFASQAITEPTSYSEALWFKTTTTQGGYLMGFGSSASGATNDDADRQVWMSDDGALHFGTYDDGSGSVTIDSSQAYNDGGWHFVVATQSSDGMHLYVDGTEVASNSSPTVQGYLGYWRVGGTSLTGWSPTPTSDFFGGSISDVSFYNSELSSSQVSGQYAASPAARSSSAPSGP